MNIKKILSLIVAVVMLPCVSVFSAEQNEEFDERIQTVVALGFAEGDENGNLNLDANITRAEMVTLLWKLTNGNDDIVEATGNVFADVDQFFWASGYIESMYHQGLILGDGDRCFRPKDNVKMAEADSIFVNISGHGVYMESDNYPENVTTLANKLGLNKGIQAGPDDFLTRRDMFIMIYNLLHTDVYLVEYDPEFKMSYKLGDTYLCEKLDIYTEKGIVEAVDGVALNNRIIADDYVSIDGELFFNNNVIDKTSIGLYGKYYYQDDDGDKILRCFIPSGNNVLELSTEQIDDYQDDRYKYEKGTSYKYAKVSAGKDILYNGQFSINDENMIPSYGTVKLIDNDGDNVYDVVMINQYKNVFATAINVHNEVIACSVFKEGKEQREFLELSDYSEFHIYDMKGTEIGLEALADQQLLALQESDDGAIAIYACSTTVTGSVEKVGRDDYGRSAVTVNGTEYVLLDGYYTRDWNGTLNAQVKLYLDMLGNVGAVFLEETTDAWKYGYVMKAYVGDGEDSDRIYLKMLTQEGSIQHIPTYLKAKLDGETLAQTEESCAQIMNADQIIRYKLNVNGEIQRIDLASEKSAYDLDRNRNYSTDNALLKRCDGELQYNQNMRAWRRYKAMTLEGQAFVDDNTILFKVPIDQSAAQDSDYSVSTVTPWTWWEGLNRHIVAYNEDQGSLTASVIVEYDASSTISTEALPMLVDTVESTVLEDDSIGYLVTGLYDGNSASYAMDNETFVRAGSIELNRGDLIRVSIDGSGQIKAYEMLYNEAGTGILNSNACYGINDSSSWGVDWRYIKGYVENIVGDEMLLKFDESTQTGPYEIYHTGDFNVYVYDKNQKQPVYFGNVSDILDYNTSPSQYDTVILGSRNASPKEIIIIKR